MAKRNRKLPDSILGSSSGREPSKQTILAIHHDSDSSSDSQPRPGTSSRRPRSGMFTQSTKRSKVSVSNLAASAAAAAPTEFTEHGVRIKFPFKPYKSQQDMMSRIVEALQKQENALLESPTGSGKSLALLCGALAWLEAEKEKIRGQRAQGRQDLEQSLALQANVESPYFNTADAMRVAHQPPNAGSSSMAGDSASTSDPKSTAGLTPCGSCVGSCGGDALAESKKDLSDGHASGITVGSRSEDEEDDDFQSARIRVAHGKKRAVELTYEDDRPTLGTKESALMGKIAAAVSAASALHELPKIYFGSRTHKQITQLVKELKSNTVYRPKMVVLGGRNHYCIQPKLKKLVNKNDACQELLDVDACHFKFKAADLSERFLQPKNGANRIWDMEDLIKKGKSINGCPYFAARALALNAELILCPYNYLIDPQIRKAMDIDVDNSIIILDEAHNIEDASREAGGLEVQESDLAQARLEFGEMIKENVLANDSKMLLNLSAMFSNILETQTSFSIQEYEQSTEIWTSRKLLDHLANFGLNNETIGNYESAGKEIEKALKMKKDMAKSTRQAASKGMEPRLSLMEEEASKVMVSPRTLRVMEGLVVILTRLLDVDLDCLEDYAIALVESVDRSEDGQNRDGSGSDDNSTEEDNAGSSIKAKKKKVKKRRYNNGQAPLARGSLVQKKRTVKFWCFNPGVIFRPLSSQARSVILTSGTLSPMDSFASELQTSFPIQLEADHVVEKSQVWTGVIPYGPSSIKIDGTYQSAGSFQFQDELGLVLQRVIEKTPHGVLCFLSSYHLMETLMNRWRTTGQYDRLCATKKVIQEPRNATSKVFDRTLQGYYDHIAAEVARGSNGGALLFAVFRGKCSEGIDFTDTNCRAVLAVGIPFPSQNDLKVKLKKEYNDKQSRRRPLPISQINLGLLSHSTGSLQQSASHSAAIAQLPSAARRLLSGKRWYEIQAFRAYNQAIGRCIRHRKDWGAMILLDFRFTMPHHRQNLSKWVRPLVKTHTIFEEGLCDLTKWMTPLSNGMVNMTENKETIKAEVKEEEDAVHQNILLEQGRMVNFGATAIAQVQQEAVNEALIDPVLLQMKQDLGRFDRSMVVHPVDQVPALAIAQQHVTLKVQPASDLAMEVDAPLSPRLEIRRVVADDEADLTFDREFDAAGSSDKIIGSQILPEAEAPFPAILSTQLSWGHAINTPLENMSLQNREKTASLGDHLTVVCRACGERLLSCNERPKIKTVQKSMAEELLQNRKILLRNPSQSQVGPASESETKSFGSFMQNETGPSSAVLPSKVMILAVQSTSVQELLFDPRVGAKEFDCVWRPQDGLFYRRIMCQECSKNDPKDEMSPKDDAGALRGWKGVVIVGMSGRGSGMGYQEVDVGSCWLTPGEIQTL